MEISPFPEETLKLFLRPAENGPTAKLLIYLKSERQRKLQVVNGTGKIVPD
jgi:hypothetical protein